MSRSRRWIFTLNNWTTEEQDKLRAAPLSYLFYGREVGAEGTPHLQGWLVATSAVTMSALKTKLGSTRYHLEPMRGTPEQNYKYCKKEGDWEEHGTPPAPGRRNDLREVIVAVQEGQRDMKRLREDYPEVCAKFPRFVRDIIVDNTPPPKCPDICLRDWQARLVQDIKAEPHDRKIIFIVDVQGGAGKTTFCKYLMAVFSNVQFMDPGKNADMAYELRETTRVLLMDCPRSRAEMMQYHFLERVKDGIVFSGKYEPTTKYIGPCHVIVFMNEQPDESKLSRDRFDIRHL